MGLVRMLDVVTTYVIAKQNMKKKRANLMRLLSSSSEFLNEFDLNGDGKVSRYEFFYGMLVQQDIVNADRINEIMAIFYNTDKNGDGHVDVDELRLKVAQDRMRLKWGPKAFEEINAEWEAIKQQQEQLKEERIISERQQHEWNEQKERDIKYINPIKEKGNIEMQKSNSVDVSEVLH